MAFQLRTFGAGVAVLALCFMLACLSWQFLLLGFATASIAWAFWSWSSQLNPPREQPREKPAQFERKRRQRRADVVQFPAQDWGNRSSTGY